MKNIILVGIGGFAGSILRYLFSMYSLSFYSGKFPLATFLVNVIGCLLIGLTYGFAERFEWMSPQMRMLLATGFCGGFTTFSAFAFENVKLLQNNEYGLFAGYVILSVVFCILATIGGILLSRV